MDKTEQNAEAEVEEVTEKEDEVPEPEESVKAKSPDELKVVIILNPGKVMLGVQSTDCDPVYTTFDGTLPTALRRIPKFIEEAKQKWSESPRYPDANLPAPEPASVTAKTAAAPKEKPKQPSFF